MILNRPGDRLREQILSVPARRLRATRPMVRMAWVLLAVDVLAAVAITVMVILHTAPSATVPATAALVFMALSFAVVGGLLSQRRPRNAEGWLLLAVGTAWLVPMVSVGSASHCRSITSAGRLRRGWPGRGSGCGCRRWAECGGAVLTIDSTTLLRCVGVGNELDATGCAAAVLDKQGLLSHGYS